MSVARPKKHIIVRMVRTDEELADAKALMREVAQERNWPADSVIDGYAERSLYWIAYDPKGVVIGAVKLIHGDSVGFPMKNPGSLLEEQAWPSLQISESGGVAEVAFAAIRKQHRGDRDTLLALYSKMYWDIQSFGIRYIYAILDRMGFNLFRRMGLNFVELDTLTGGGKKIYWGEETFPARLDLAEMVRRMEETRPRTWNFIQSYQGVA